MEHTTLLAFDDITFLSNGTVSTTKAPNVIPQAYVIARRFFFNSMPFLFVIGSVGNILSYLVFSRSGMRHSVTAIFFRCLSINEALFIIVDTLPLIIDYFFGIETMESMNELCRLWNFTVWSTRDIAAWTLALVSMERCVGITIPHRVKTIFTHKRAKILLTVTTIVILIRNCPLVILYKSVDLYGNGRRVCRLAKDLPGWKYFTSAIWPWWDFSFYSVGPSVVIFLCNTIVIFALAKAARARRMMSNSADSDSKNTEMTVLLVIVSVTYLILSLPVTVYRIIGPKMVAKNVYNANAFLLPAYFLQFFNHSCNFYLYCLSGTRFRKELIGLFKRGNNTPNQSNSSHTATSGYNATKKAAETPNNALETRPGQP